MSAATAQPTGRAAGRWLFGALPDLLLGCGLLYVLVFAAHAVAGPSLRQATPIYLLPLLVLLLSSPHYGATLVRVYEERRERRAYALFSVWTTLVLGALFVASLGSPLLGSLAFTLYLTWSPWHYSGQNYGLSVMFLGRRGVPPDPRAKRWLYATFQLSFLLAALVMHLEVGSAYSPVGYEGTVVSFLPIGITRSVGDWLLPVVAGAYLASLLGAAVVLRRKASWSDLLPTGALVLTQALWFAVPFSVQYWGWQTGLEPLDRQHQFQTYLFMIFAGHGAQYLWVTTYYARAAPNWHGYGRYWLKVAAAGIGIWTLPAVLLGPVGLAGGLAYVASLPLLIAAFVNLHHFILDGAIWKLRNSRIAAVLIRSAEEQDGDTPALASPRRWLRVATWSAAGVGLAAGVAGFYLTLYVPGAIQRGDLLRASDALRVSGWLGPNEWVMHKLLSERFERDGDLRRAVAHARSWVGLSPSGENHVTLGRLEARRGNHEAARRAYEAALADGTARADRVHAGLARLALQGGDEAAAARHLRAALEERRGPGLSSQLARLLATARDPSLRDPEAAVELAEAAVAQRETPAHLETLATAYAASGRDADAARAASRARDLAAGSRGD